MKFSIKLPTGGTLDFEGDVDEFTRLQEFLAAPPDSLTTPRNEEGAGIGTAGNGEDAEQIEGTSPLDPRNVAARIKKVGATTDMELMTVIAQLAVEAGQDGADYELTDTLFTDLGLRKPSRFTKSVANAKSAGLVRTASYGRWRPTVKGENFARGLGRSREDSVVKLKITPTGKEG